jgi:hypothetical protein
MPSQKNDRIAELPAIDVIYETGEKGRPISEQAPAAFDRLEARLPSLKGKKFYGAVIDGQYRACAAIDEDAAGIDLPRWVIPGGRYLVRTIADWEQHRETIGATVAALLDRDDLDRTRPVIEFYRSQAELRILAPIK